MTARARPIGGWNARPFRVDSLWASLALLALAIAAAGTMTPLNHDVAWILLGAERLLDGAEFGRDIVDVNPPLAWWLATVPAAAGRMLGIGAATASHIFVSLLALASIAFTGAVLARAGWAGAASRPFLLVAGAILLVAPGYDHGQREHLLLIAALPYLAAAGAAAEGRRLPPGLATALGAFAGIGFCLKPYFLLIPVFTEFWLLLRTRSILLSFRPENLAIVAVGSLYGAAMLLWAPAYLTAVLPGAWSSYWAYDSPLAAVAARAAPACLTLAAAGALLGRRAFAGNGLAQALLAGAFAALAAALVQLKGWPYQLLPLTGLGGLACAALALGPAGRERPLRAFAVLVLAATPLLAGASFLGRAVAQEEVPADRLAAAFAAAAPPGAPIFAFVTSPRDIHPAVVEAGASWPYPSCCLHLLPAAVRADEAGSATASIEARAAGDGQLASLLLRLERDPPAIIVLDARRTKLGFGGRAFDYRAYLSSDRRFGRLLGQYREREPVDGFRIFVRRQRLRAAG